MGKSGQTTKRKSAEVQAAIRLQIVKYLKKKLGTQKQASIVFGLSIDGVHKIWKRYRQGEVSKIAKRKRGVRGGKKINGIQAAEVRRLIRERLPDQLKLPLWLMDT